MRKLLLVLILSCTVYQSRSQTLQEKLYYTCKVWGFAKYYHSEVSVCHVNWDSVLLHVLPLVRSAATNAQFNDALDTMLLAAGPMALATTYLPPITDPMLTKNKDWSWIASPVLRADVQEILDTIKNNFRPHAMCQVDYNYGGSLSAPYGGYLKFPPDTIMLQTTMTTSYPDADHRMQMFFKMWNMMRYFNPYNYILTTPIDTTLFNFVLPFDNATNINQFNLTYLRFATALDDAHVYGLTYMYALNLPPGKYAPRLLLRYIEGGYVVVRSLEPGISPGDVIQSVDGLTIKQWEDSLMQFYSAGSIEIKRRTVATRLLTRASIGINEMIVFTDSTGGTKTATVATVNSSSSAYSNFYSAWYYPADTLTGVKWSIFNCNVGYMNMGNLTDGATDSAYDAMQGLPGIVVDTRNYPQSGNAWALSDKLLAGPATVTMLTIPDVTYPGTYTWKPVTMGVAGNPAPYSGKVVVIVDENTQSAAEYTTMMQRAYPNCTVIGSHTAGADGNVTFLQPAQDMRFGWTSMGVYYPNYDSTQRVGIIPDVYAYPTKEGVRHQRDYVLEQALAIAGCYTGVENAAKPIPVVSLFPNPARSTATVDIAYATFDKVEILVCDITGKTLMTQEIKRTGDHTRVSLDVSTLPAGLYLLKVNSGMQNTVTKLTVQ